MQNLPEFEKIKNHLLTLQNDLEILELKKQVLAEQAGRSKEELEDMIRLYDCGEKYRKTGLKIKALSDYIKSVESLADTADAQDVIPDKTLQNDLYCNRESHNDFILAILSFFKYQSTTKLLIEDFICKAELSHTHNLGSQKT